MATLGTKISAAATAAWREASGARAPVRPEQVVRSIPESWLNPAVREHVLEHRVLRGACVEGYALPETLAPAFRREMHFARRHLYELGAVSVRVRTGACAAGSLYFQEYFGSLGRCLVEEPFPQGTGRRLQIPGPVACVHLAGYYHFLLEELPRFIWTLRHYPELTLVVHRSAPRYVLQALALLRTAQGTPCRLEMLDDEVVEVPRYVFTQAEAYSGFVHGADLELLRAALVPVQAGPAGRRIYLTHRGASRSFANEERVAARLAELGFEVHALVDLELSGQIELFGAACVVVAPHGAGLANLAWCRPGTRVVEVFSPVYFNDCYARLSAQLGLCYAPLWAEEGGRGNVPLERLAELAVQG